MRKMRIQTAERKKSGPGARNQPLPWASNARIEGLEFSETASATHFIPAQAFVIDFLTCT